MLLSQHENDAKQKKYLKNADVDQILWLESLDIFTTGILWHDPVLMKDMQSFFPSYILCLCSFLQWRGARLLSEDEEETINIVEGTESH